MTPLRRTLALAFVGALMSAGALVAPSNAAVSSEVTSVPAQAPKVYGQKSSGKTVKVKKGQTIKIRLKTITDGGYSWKVTKGKGTAIFKIVSKKVVQAPQTGSTPVVGAPSYTVYTLKAKKRGTATFKAVERREFDKKDVIKRFTLHIKVTKP